MPLPRRALLHTAGVSLAGVGLAGCTGDGAKGVDSTSNAEDTGTSTGDVNESKRTEGGGDFDSTHKTYSIMEGSVYETTVHVLESTVAGPTAVVLGGVHGDETGGVEAAHIATKYAIGQGSVVVIPEMNKPAVRADSRQGPDGDLNRQFPVDEGPTSELARAVWRILRRYEPDSIIDMHTSKGVYQLHDVGVGQTVFPHGGQEAITDAHAVTTQVNEQYLGKRLGNDLPEGYAFQPVYGEHEHNQEGASEENRMLVPTATQEFDLKGWITEVTYRGFDLEEQAFLHDRLTTALLERNAILVQSPLDDADNPLLDN